MKTAHFHLPGLFEFYEFYKVFLPIFENHREYFYEWVDIASIYGAPTDCIWAGGRVECSDTNVEDVIKLLKKYDISLRLTFSNSLLKEEHLLDRQCNRLCEIFNSTSAKRNSKEPDKVREKTTNDAPVDTLACTVQNGIIVHSELLLNYLRNTYPNLYFISSTTKVLTDFEDFHRELKREEFRYVVPDFRINKQMDKLNLLSSEEKEKVEFLCNECCYIGCTDRRICYENVSKRILDGNTPEHVCNAPGSREGYRFSKAMQSPAFISVEDIKNIYLPNGFTNFKIEGRSLGSAVVLEMLLYYMVKPKYQLIVREEIYLDSMLDLF